ETFHLCESLKTMAERIVSLTKEYMDCDAVALRMKDGDDYPYFVSNGFPQGFIESENHLCIYDEKGHCLRDSHGNPLLACMCGIVVNAKFDPDRPFFTKQGSFWTNSTTALLASTTAETRGGTTRNTCNQDGYESVSLIPIKSGGDNIGLLQINAKRRNLFSLRRIQFLEELGYLIGIAVDRKKTEAAVRSSEVKYKTLVESAGEGIATIDEVGVCLFLNTIGAKRLGGKPEDYIGKTMWDLFPKEIADQQVADIRRVIKSEQGEDLTILTEIQGRPRWYNMTIEPLRDHHGNVTATMIIARNIDEEKRKEERLRILSSTIESSINGIAISDTKGKLTYVNRSFLKMWGYRDESEVLGRNAVEFWQEQDKASKVIDTLQDQEGWVGELTGMRKNGSTFDVQVSACAITNVDNRMPYMVASFIDITESKRKETELGLYREKMTRAEQLASLGTVGATVAHELTQPLTVIRLSIENCLADLDTTSCPDAVTEGLFDSLAGVSDAVSIIKRFRSFARKSTLGDVGQVDLLDAAKKVTHLLNEQAWRAKVAVHIENMDRLPPMFMNVRDLEQLFFVLVQNTIQAADGEKDRKLTIRAEFKGEYIELQFSDNCGGIPAENIDKIFEPFFTTKPSGTATGLGLCIVQRIVSDAGGRVRVESQAGKGSTFFITLPITKDRRNRLNGDDRQDETTRVFR
ncbi:PAS domain S-box protein, partial [Planctomycetota bacterium]